MLPNYANNFPVQQPSAAVQPITPANTLHYLLTNDFNNNTYPQWSLPPHSVGIPPSMVHKTFQPTFNTTTHYLSRTARPSAQHVFPAEHHQKLQSTFVHPASNRKFKPSVSHNQLYSDGDIKLNTLPYSLNPVMATQPQTTHHPTSGFSFLPIPPSPHNSYRLANNTCTPHDKPHISTYIHSSDNSFNSSSITSNTSMHHFDNLNHYLDTHTQNSNLTGNPSAELLRIHSFEAAKNSFSFMGSPTQHLAHRNASTTAASTTAASTTAASTTAASTTAASCGIADRIKESKSNHYDNTLIPTTSITGKFSSNKSSVGDRISQPLKMASLGVSHTSKIEDESRNNSVNFVNSGHSDNLPFSVVLPIVSKQPLESNVARRSASFQLFLDSGDDSAYMELTNFSPDIVSRATLKQSRRSAVRTTLRYPHSMTCHCHKSLVDLVMDHPKPRNVFQESYSLSTEDIINSRVNFFEKRRIQPLMRRLLEAIVYYFNDNVDGSGILRARQESTLGKTDYLEESIEASKSDNQAKWSDGFLTTVDRRYILGGIFDKILTKCNEDHLLFHGGVAYISTGNFNTLLQSLSLWPLDLAIEEDRQEVLLAIAFSDPEVQRIAFEGQPLPYTIYITKKSFSYSLSVVPFCVPDYPPPMSWSIIPKAVNKEEKCVTSNATSRQIAESVGSCLQDAMEIKEISHTIKTILTASLICFSILRNDIRSNDFFYHNGRGDSQQECQSKPNKSQEVIPAICRAIFTYPNSSLATLQECLATLTGGDISCFANSLHQDSAEFLTFDSFFSWPVDVVTQDFLPSYLISCDELQMIIPNVDSLIPVELIGTAVRLIISLALFTLTPTERQTVTYPLQAADSLPDTCVIADRAYQALFNAMGSAPTGSSREFLLLRIIFNFLQSSQACRTLRKVIESFMPSDEESNTDDDGDGHTNNCHTDGHTNNCHTDGHTNNCHTFSSGCTRGNQNIKYNCGGSTARKTKEDQICRLHDFQQFTKKCPEDWGNSLHRSGRINEPPGRFSAKINASDIGKSPEARNVVMREENLLLRCKEYWSGANCGGWPVSFWTLRWCCGVFMVCLTKHLFPKV